MDKQTILSYKNFEALSNGVIALAKEILPDKVIYINFLNKDVQITMKVSQHDTKVNVSEGETIPVEEAVCNQIDYEQGVPLILDNIKENSFDEKVNQTIDRGNLGSYLGIPIRYQDGSRFGALCAAHHDKSSFDAKDVELLRNIARLFSYYLELENIAFKDALTGLYNPQFIKAKHEEILTNDGVAILLDLDNFKQVNDTFGHDVGDEVLKEFAQKLEKFTKNYKTAFAARLGGDEFFVHLREKINSASMRKALADLVVTLQSWKTEIGEVKLSSSIGAMNVKKDSFDSFASLYRTVDLLLYKAKNEGKNTFIYQV